jgi:hypothetical protein
MPRNQNSGEVADNASSFIFMDFRGPKTAAEPLIQNQLLDRSVSLRLKEIRILQKRVWMECGLSVDALRSLKEAGNATTPFPRANAEELLEP